MKKRPQDPDALIEWFERMVQIAAEMKDEFVKIQTGAAEKLLARLKSAKRPRRGRKATYGRQIGREAVDVFATRSLAQKIFNEGKLTRAAALEKAAKEIALRRQSEYYRRPNSNTVHLGVANTRIETPKEKQAIANPP